MGSVPIFLLLAAHVLSMLGFATYSALLPELRDLWQLTNAEAGLVGSAFYAGYVATVSYWTALTDRTDSRRVYLAGGLLSAAGAVGFGWLAQGLATALAFQALIGAASLDALVPRQQARVVFTADWQWRHVIPSRSKPHGRTVQVAGVAAERN